MAAKRPQRAQRNDAHEREKRPPVTDSLAGARDPTMRPVPSIPAPPTVDERVAEVCEWMRELWWDTGRSVAQFAAAWGLSESTIRNYSSEAHRIVLAEVNADEADRETGLALRRVMRDALKVNDRVAVIRAAEVWATLKGAKAPTRNEHSGPGGGPIPIPVEPRAAMDAKLDALRNRLQGAGGEPSGNAGAQPDPKG